jgi:hypothetical protein
LRKETKLALLNKIILITITVVIVLFSLISFLSIAALAQTTEEAIPSLTTASQQLQQEQTEQSSWQIYENPVYGFRIQYPSDWNITRSSLEEEERKQIEKEEDEETGRQYHYIDFESPEGSLLSVSIELNASPQYLDTDTLTLKNKTAHDIVSEEIAQLPSLSLNWSFTYKILRDYESTLAGRPAWNLEQIQNHLSGSSKYSKDIYTIKDDKVYHIHISSDLLLVPKTLSVAQKMIDSFEFIK